MALPDMRVSILVKCYLSLCCDGDHDEVLARVATRIERPHFYRADAGDTGKPVTVESVARIVHGGLIAIEYDNNELAARLLADVHAEAAESGALQQPWAAYNAVTRRAAPYWARDLVRRCS